MLKFTTQVWESQNKTFLHRMESTVKSTNVEIDFCSEIITWRVTGVAAASTGVTSYGGNGPACCVEEESIGEADNDPLLKSLYASTEFEPLVFAKIRNAM